MSLKGTRTEQNLLAAFSGESMARNKYLFFAEKARTEGNLDVANLFTDLAQNEGAAWAVELMDSVIEAVRVPPSA